ncbi:MAG: hypothetical protein HY595_02485 [Candidatus Omnitrophica bacterium]|nr:hypothetical protein [Candidatus Omnitrophota bacterium]
MVSVKELESVFNQAAGIAGRLPEAMQSAGFTLAVNWMVTNKRSASNLAMAGNLRQNTGSEESSDAEIGVLLQKIDRTAYPEIQQAGRVLDRSLIVLRVVRDQFSMDGLNAIQIAKVLTEKFRMKATHQAVRQALDKAGDKVDRVPSGKGATRYRLMQAGEAYLDQEKTAMMAAT